MGGQAEHKRSGKCWLWPHWLRRPQSNEHYWMAAKYIEAAPDLAEEMRAALTVDELHTLAVQKGQGCHAAPGWEDAKYGVLLNVL